jgi:hypothetical protein
MLKFFKWVLLLIVLIGIYLVWLNRWWIYDEYRLYGYTPPGAISTIAQQDQLTPYARTLLYVYRPDLENSLSFNNNCKVTQTAIVLGCTIIGQGIYIYNISDPTLNGIEQVTAAYEMLHVGYSRLSTSERNYIDNLVMQTYYKLAPTNPLLKSEYNSYMATEGQSAIKNEMHSTIGTQISVLPVPLEKYYQRYFINRQVIVDYTNQYQSVFNSRENLVKADDQKLATLKVMFDNDENTLSGELTNIKNMQNTLNTLKANQQYTQYNAEVTVFNSAVDSYNSLLTTYKDLISQYNSLVNDRNTIALSENKLTQEISSLSTSSLTK